MSTILSTPDLDRFFSVYISEPEEPKIVKADSLPRRHSYKAIAAAIEAADLGKTYTADREGERGVFLKETIGCLYNFGVAEDVRKGQVVGYMACDEYQNIIDFAFEGRRPYTLAEAVDALKELVASERKRFDDEDDA